MRRTRRLNIVQEGICFFGLYFLCGMLIQVYPTPGAWGFVAVTLLLALRAVSLVLLWVILPAFHITGGILRDFADTITTVYDFTLGPVLRFLAPLVGAGYRHAAAQFGKDRAAGQEDDQADTSRQQTREQPFTEKEREERWRRRQQERESMRQQAPTQNPCFDILGIDQAADFEEGKRAYLALTKQYHPDKVSHLGPEFRELAERRFKAISSAWTEFKLLHGKREE